MSVNPPRDTKQVIVLRKDLNMRKGKMAAQACHASLRAFTLAQARSESRWIEFWRACREAKIVVGVDSEQALFDLESEAARRNIPHALIKDAGLTEFKEPTYTALALGPYWSDIINQVTGDLKLL